MTATSRPARMTSTDRAALIARAKRAAVPVASCVSARLSPAHITGMMTRAEVEALVIVLAEAVDHAVLQDVCAAEDDGQPDETDAEARQRKAHAEAGRLRKAGQPVPFPVRVLDNAYRAGLKGRREANTPKPDPKALRNRAVLDRELHSRAVRRAS